MSEMPEALSGQPDLPVPVPLYPGEVVAPGDLYYEAAQLRVSGRQISEGLARLWAMTLEMSAHVEKLRLGIERAEQLGRERGGIGSDPTKNKLQ